jgi:hypothetical protein
VKLLLVLSMSVAAAVGARLWLVGAGVCSQGSSCCWLTSLSAPGAERAKASEPAGRYVEARTVNVFAGACHYNGEAMSSGREALLAWTFESGSYEGTDLAGVDVIAAVASNANLYRKELGEEGLASEVRRSIVYVDAGASEAQRAAAVKYVRELAGDALGEVIAVEPREIEVDIEGDRYFAHAGDQLRLEGSALPGRECCKMPYDVWYEPLAPIDGRIVGQSERFVWRESRLAPRFERSSQNDAFVGTFGA